MEPIVIRHLTKIFEERQGALRAIDDLSLTIPAGECWGLLGPNGAGKSTTIACLSGALVPTAGEVFLHGISVQKNPRHARAHLGLVRQEDALESEFTVEQQLLAYGLYFGLEGKKLREKIPPLLERFNLGSKAKAMPYALSGGMKRRLMLARALLPDPSVLVLDEPTAGLDPQARQTIQSAIQTARHDGMAILLTTHYMQEAERLCDRIILLHRGRVIDTGSPEELVRRHIALDTIEEEIRPGIVWRRPPNLEDVFLKMTGTGLGNYSQGSESTHRSREEGHVE